MENKKISIIGLGLIGGSLAKALNRIGMKDITAVDVKNRNIQDALDDGIITHGFNVVNDFVLDSDIIFICTPVKHALEYINIFTGRVKPDCIITDVCSTKGEIINYINQMPSPPCFIGGHPMAGTERTGYVSGFAHLFENAYYILTPCKSTSEYTLNFMMDLISGIGSIPILLDAEEHDRITGSISHVPHIIASALVNMVKTLDSPEGKMQMLAAGGFKDITRIASSNPEMWESIISSNKELIKNILEEYIQTIKNFTKMIDNDSSEEIYSFFKSARDYRNSFSSDKRGLISSSYEIIVDVIDKPGIIGEIATILGNNNINIKNINVSNSREYEQGCLKINLAGADSVEKSVSLLKKNGYKVFKTL